MTREKKSPKFQIELYLKRKEKNKEDYSKNLQTISLNSYWNQCVQFFYPSDGPITLFKEGK